MPENLKEKILENIDCEIEITREKDTLIDCYVKNETFNLFYEDFIEFKCYVNDVIKSNLREKSNEFNTSKIEQLEKDMECSKQSMKVLTDENDVLKNECASLLKIVEILAHKNDEIKGSSQNKITINKENGDETEWERVENKKSVKRNECNILENKKVIETNNRYCILEDYQEETPSDINNPFGVDFNILNKANNNGSFINNQSFMQSDS